MKWATLKRIWALYRVNHWYAGTNAFEKKRKLLNRVGFALGEGTRVVAPLYCSGTLKTGKNCWIGRGFALEGNGSVTVGDNCDIAPNVSFLTGGHAIGDHTRRAGAGEIYRITVGNGTWIGARATVLGNTTIGDGCVVAACACVTSDVSDNTLVGGVPARIIKEWES